MKRAKSTARYIVGKLIGFAVTLFAVSLLIFFLERLSNVSAESGRAMRPSRRFGKNSG